MDRRLFERVSYSSLLIMGVFLLGLVLRLICLDCHSLWYDEIASIEVAQRGLAAIFTDRFGWMHVQTPLHYLLVWLTIQPVDPTTTALLVRLPSALAGALTPLVVYGLGKEMFGRAQGLVAALLMALATVHLEYSQDVRPYAVLTLLTAASVYCLLRAERSHSVRWWTAFTLLTIVNVLNSYNVLTLALPALAPYLLWLLWKLARRWRNTSGTSGSWRPLACATLSLLMVGAVAAFMFADMMQVPRTPPRWSKLSLAGMIWSPVEMVTWYTQFGLGGQPERLAQLALLIFAFLGVFLAVRRAGTAGSISASGATLCVLFAVVPATIMAILQTTNVVYQRYALFSIVFYFLLIGNGFVSSFSLLGPSWRLRFAGLLRGVTIGIGATILVLSALAVRFYVINDMNKPLVAIDRPDFRHASAYLTRHASEQDTIVFAGWDPTTSNFYWKDSPPQHVFSILDPLFVAHHNEGAIYWVVSYDFGLPPQMAQDPNWTEVQRYYRVRIFREDPPSSDIRPSMERFIAGLEQLSPRSRAAEHVIMNLRGTLHQGRGEAAEAADAYLTAGLYFPIGEEYLRTSKDFGARGEMAKAWRDALISKSMQPYSPELHEWLAQMLSGMGLESESQAEVRVANSLRVKYPQANASQGAR